MKRFLWCLLLLGCLFPVSALGSEEGDAVYQLLDDGGEAVTWYAGTPEPGDEYISGDNRYYRVRKVDPAAHLAVMEPLGIYALPEITWLSQEEAQEASAVKKAVALYCTHSDESYEPTDGASSKENRGGIYDVAESLKGQLEKRGVTVYYSDENHYPHDAGAYRRSRATAASLAEEGVDALFDVHRDGIPDASQYESSVNGKEVTKVRLLVGRSNQNAEANKQFAAQIKAVADKLYPGLVKDIYMGKGSYNQDLMSQAVLLEFGTHKSDKNEVLASTSLMADVLNRALYGGVTGSAKGDRAAKAPENSGGWVGMLLLALLFFGGIYLYALASSGRLSTASQKWKRSLTEMTGGLLGGRRREGPRDE